MKEQIETIMSMLRPDFDWTDCYDEVEELFRQLITDAGAYAMKSVGSYRPSDGAKALFRLLYLCQPESVKFDDMYKPRLFYRWSPCQRFLVSVELFKYEPALYFYALPEYVHDSNSGPLRVTCGVPGADNGVRCTDPDGLAWFEMWKAVVEHEFVVYGGNDFVV